MRDFKSLQVWEKAHQLVLGIYRFTERFPASEAFNMTSQMRRAATSIPTNIAEGCGRDSDPDMARFLDIAMGSSKELEYLIMLAHDLKFMTTEDAKRLWQENDEIQRMLAAFTRTIRPVRKRGNNRPSPPPLTAKS